MKKLLIIIAILAIAGAAWAEVGGIPVGVPLSNAYTGEAGTFGVSTDNPKEKSCRWEYEFLLLYPKMQSWWDGRTMAPPENAYMTWGEIVNEALKKYPGWEIDEKRFRPDPARPYQNRSGMIEIWLKRRVCE